VTYLSRSVAAPLLLLKRSTSTGKSFGDMNLKVVEPKKYRQRFLMGAALVWYLLKGS
jgi:hypothetical protein